MAEPGSTEVVREVRRSLRELGACGRSLLLAVSGGVDSLALLHCCAALRDELRLSLEVVTVDHGLRAESVHEAQAVRALAEDLGLPFHAPALRLSRGAALEARARDARYAALEEVRLARGLDWVATAHTANDQAETLLMRLARGTSGAGASAIRKRRGNILRPMLCLTRERVEAYVRTAGLRPVEDPMNADLAFTRVRVRRHVIPALNDALGPVSVAHLARFAIHCEEDEAFLRGAAADTLERLRLVGGGLELTGVRLLPPALRRRVLKQLMEEAGVPCDASAIERALEAVARGGRTQLPRGVELRCAGGRVRCVRPAEAARDAPPSTLGSEILELEVGGAAQRFQAADVLVWATRSREASIGATWSRGFSCATPRVLVRSWRAGDRCEGRKVQDLLVNARVPREARRRVPIVCDAAGRVLWVVGVYPGADRRAQVGSERGAQFYVHVRASSAAPVRL